jgi:hypothetical protein
VLCSFSTRDAESGHAALGEFGLEGIATHRQESMKPPGILRGEAQQFSVERRMNQVKAALSNAIKRCSQDLVARRIPVESERQCLLKSPSDLRVYLRR